MNMKDRLAEFLKQQGLTPGKLANLLEVQPSSISHLLSGRNKPGFEFIVKFLQCFPSVNPDWLLLGKGTIFRNADIRKSTPRTSEEKLSNKTELYTSSRPKDQTTTNHIEVETEHPTLPFPKTNSQKEIQFKLPEQKRVAEQIIICFDDHTFTIYNQRK